MRRIRFATLVLGLATVVCGAFAAPAQAEQYVDRDPAGDMRQVNRRTGATTTAPAHRNLDLRRVVVRHQQHRVVIRAKMTALRAPRAGSPLFLRGFIRVNRRARLSTTAGWSWEVEFKKRHPRRGTRLFILDDWDQEWQTCDGWENPRLRASADYRRDEVRVIIPRHCLSPTPHLPPSWVRVSVTTAHTDRVQYFDHLGRPRLAEPWPNPNQPHFTPRLTPGPKPFLPVGIVMFN